MILLSYATLYAGHPCCQAPTAGDGIRDNVTSFEKVIKSHCILLICFLIQCKAVGALRSRSSVFASQQWCGMLRTLNLKQMHSSLSKARNVVSKLSCRSQLLQAACEPHMLLGWAYYMYGMGVLRPLGWTMSVLHGKFLCSAPRCPSQ
jgi:hypothetical protein